MLHNRKLEWIHQHLHGHAWIAIAGGVASLLVSVIVTLVVLVRLPADTFVREHAGLPLEGQPKAIRWAALVAKNIAGWLLIAVGIVLSLPGIPGQGLLTVLLGIMLVNLPGKRRVERWILGRKTVKKTTDKLRARFGRPPIELED